MSVIPDVLFHRGGVPIDSLSGWDAGNVYWVIDSDHTQYATFIRDRQGMYENDKSEIVHSTIQSALNATVTKRNDYVIVVPHPHNVFAAQTVALTMSKSHVHLICPTNIGAGGVGIFSPVIQQTGAYACITLSGHYCEIGGLFFAGKQSKDIIDISSGTWGAHIHDNFFGMSSTDGSDNKAIDATVAYVFNIHHNHFTNFSPGAMKTTANDLENFILFSGGGTTRGTIANNTMSTGNNTEVTSAISVNGSDLLIQGNTIWETGAYGIVADKGTLTAGITHAGSATGLIADNRIGTSDASTAIVGGTAISCINNYSSVDGGTIIGG